MDNIITALTEQMVPFDYFVSIVVCASAIIGLYRGFFRELFSLLAWLASIWSSWFYYPAMVLALTPYISDPFIVPAAVISLFFLFLILFTSIARVLEHFVTLCGLSFLNRPLGVAFGAVRGVAVGFIILSILMVSPMREELWLHQSMTHRHFGEKASRFLDSMTKGRYSNIPSEFLSQGV